MSSVKVAPLDNVVVFSLGAISLWSGRARLQPEDLGAASIDLPPAAVASLGSKRLISSDILVKLDKVKRKMYRLCGSVGAKFLNGFAVSVDKAEGLAGQLDALVAEGNRLRQELLDNFDSMLADWHRENPEWAHILKAGTPEKEAVHKRIHFGWDAFMVRAPGNDKVAQSLLGAASALGSTLYSEVAAEASDFIKKSLKPGRAKGSQRTATPVRRMVEKLRGLVFLDHRIGPLTQVFDKLIASIPSTGSVEGHAYLCMLRCAFVLADIGEMQRIGERAHDGESIEDLAAEILGQAPEASTSEPETTPAEPVSNAALSADELFDDARRTDTRPSSALRVDAGHTPIDENRPLLRAPSLLPPTPLARAAAQTAALAAAQEAGHQHVAAIDF